MAKLRSAADRWQRGREHRRALLPQLRLVQRLDHGTGLRIARQLAGRGHQPRAVGAGAEQAGERGLLHATEQNFIERSLEMRHVQVKEIMVPRPDLHALPVTASLEEALRLFTTTQRSRVPVYEENLDHIVGFVHAKDLMWALAERARSAEKEEPVLQFHLRPLLREVLIVPETKPASELLIEFRTRRAGLAIVVDEFGSILGLVTLKDVLEEMVGEIHDEFDIVKRPQVLPDGSLIFDASLQIRDLETQFGIELPDDPGYETLGGFVLARLGFIPRGGESFEAFGYRFTVNRMDHRRVAQVRILRQEPPGVCGTVGQALVDTGLGEQSPSKAEGARRRL